MGTTPDSFQRTEDFESRVDSVRLPDDAWAVFAQLDQPSTAATIAAKLGADAASVEKTIQLLIENKLVRKCLMNWREFLAQKGISTTPTRMSPAGAQPPPAVLAASARREPTSAPVRPASAAVAKEATGPAPTRPQVVSKASSQQPVAQSRHLTARPAEPAPTDPDNTITFRLGNENARRARRASLAMCITFRLGGGGAHTVPVRIAPPPVSHAQPAHEPAAPVVEPEAAAVPEPEPVLVGAACGAEPAPAQAPAPGFAPRRLRTLIDAITRKGGGGLQGQLLVYRVFLRVPPAVMFSAGIKSLSLVDDSLELSDATAYEMIRNAARAVASIDLDEAIS